MRVKAASRSDYALDRWRFISGIDIRVIVFDRYVHRWLVKHRPFSEILKRKQGLDAGFERSWVYLLSARSESGWDAFFRSIYGRIRGFPNNKRVEK